MSTTEASNSERLFPGERKIRPQAGVEPPKYIPEPIYPRMVGYAVTLAMHAINWLHMFNTFTGDVATDPDVKQFNENQLKFLTLWNVYLQMFYAALGLSCDILTLANESKDSVLLKTLKTIRDNVFSGVVFPISLSVFSIFWILFSYERSLILPPTVDRTLGHTSNHIIHTMILPVVLWEIVLRPRKTPKSHVMNLVQLNTFIGAYLVVLVKSYIQLGTWIYPIMNLLDGSILFYVFLGLSIIFMQMCYYFQWYLTHLIWDDTGKEKKVD